MRMLILLKTDRNTKCRLCLTVGSYMQNSAPRNGRMYLQTHTHTHKSHKKDLIL